MWEHKKDRKLLFIKSLLQCASALISQHRSTKHRRTHSWHSFGHCKIQWHFLRHGAKSLPSVAAYPLSPGYEHTRWAILEVNDVSLLWVYHININWVKRLLFIHTVPRVTHLVSDCSVTRIIPCFSFLKFVSLITKIRTLYSRTDSTCLFIYHVVCLKYGAIYSRQLTSPTKLLSIDSSWELLYALIGIDELDD